MVLSNELLQNHQNRISDYVCKSCSNVKLLFNGITKTHNLKEYQCPKCGKRYIPKLKSKPKPESKKPVAAPKPKPKSKSESGHNSYSYDYLSEYMKKERQELRKEYETENDYYNDKISSALKSYDDDQNKKDESSGSILMSPTGYTPKSIHLTKYLKDKL